MKIISCGVAIFAKALVEMSFSAANGERILPLRRIKLKKLPRIDDQLFSGTKVQIWCFKDDTAGKGFENGFKGIVIRYFSFFFFCLSPCSIHSFCFDLTGQQSAEEHSSLRTWVLRWGLLPFITGILLASSSSPFKSGLGLALGVHLMHNTTGRWVDKLCAPHNSESVLCDDWMKIGMQFAHQRKNSTMMQLSLERVWRQSEEIVFLIIKNVTTAKLCTDKKL